MKLKAKDVSRKVVKLEPKNTLGDARDTMIRYNISRVVVAKDFKPVGIVTEKSLSRFLFKDAIGRSLDEIRLDQVMKTDLITVGEGTDLKKCAQLMKENQISSLIVVNSNGNLTGIFTKSDLVNVYFRHYAAKNSVKDYMTKKVLTVMPSHSIHTVISTMMGNRVSRVIVVKGQKPIGIVTGHDLLPISTMIEEDTRGLPTEVSMSRRQSTAPLSGISHVLLARDVMRRDPITVTKNLDLAEAAQMMVNNRISGLPAVNSDNNLNGIVTKTDVVRALTVV